ncbi:hypothetical protein Pan44_19910 [Caulifigura coniformis]|uniref:Uncharacterized protein n=1 Tax=Caulifigura coniformis TaxID=2527983 RepID=A0A517SCW0_9PLAN|nr:hypothetical protein [Caulifigura coniformis]QDT53964.1 hypothetical protein Pan44_19910 [Caulifigura coniformis]
MFTKIKRQCNGIALETGKLLSNNPTMTETTHGGKRPGAGRKPKPPEERRDQVFSLKLTADEKRLLDDTDARTWARDVLVRAAERKAR